MDTVYDDVYYEYLSCVTEKSVSSQKFIAPKFKYHICYDVYSIDGELIKEDVIDTICNNEFCNPYNDSCINSSINETR